MRPRPADCFRAALTCGGVVFVYDVERLPDRLPVGELVVEPARPGARPRSRGRTASTGSSWKTSVEQLALEAPRDRAPVAPHGLEPHEVERPSPGRHEPGVALLAARRAAAHLGHPEARVDLLELELRSARARRTRARSASATSGADRRRAALVGAPGRRCRVGSPTSTKSESGVAVDDAMAAPLDRGRREADHVLAGDGDRVGDRRREEPRQASPEHAEERVHEDLRRLRRRPRRPPRARCARSSRGARPASGRMPGSSRAEGRAARRADRAAAPGVSWRRHDVGQRVDVEGADQARVQALEVEDEDVPVEAGDGVEDEAAR